MKSLPSPLIKICGLTRTSDVLSVASAGAHAVGINLVPSSPRCVSRDVAIDLCECARNAGLVTFAVVRNMGVSELQDLLAQVDFDWVQLHGEESPALISACGNRGIVKALSWSGREIEAQVAAEWKRHLMKESQQRPCAMLVDAYAPNQGGGTGRQARWDLLWPRPDCLDGLPLILAGGLKPDNVASAIRQTRCAGVDTASGVETAPGLKSDALIRQFVQSAQQAFQH